MTSDTCGFQGNLNKGTAGAQGRLLSALVKLSRGPVLDRTLSIPTPPKAGARALTIRSIQRIPLARYSIMHKSEKRQKYKQGYK